MSTMTSDKVANSKGDGGAGIVNTVPVSGTEFFGEEAEHLLGKLRGGASEAEESMDAGGLVGGGRWGSTEADIKWELEGGGQLQGCCE